MQAVEVAVADGDLAAAFEGEGDGCCAADAWVGVNLEIFCEIVRKERGERRLRLGGRGQEYT